MSLLTNFAHIIMFVNMKSCVPDQYEDAKPEISTDKRPYKLHVDHFFVSFEDPNKSINGLD